MTRVARVPGDGTALIIRRPNDSSPSGSVRARLAVTAFRAQNRGVRATVREVCGTVRAGVRLDRDGDRSTQKCKLWRRHLPGSVIAELMRRRLEACA
jgi:hypothetical protein